MGLQRFRTEVLKSCGGTAHEVEELLYYNHNAFEPISTIAVSATVTHFTGSLAVPPHLETWMDYAQKAEAMGAYAVLKPRLVQLQFPIAAGISETEAYQTATRKGVLPNLAAAQSGLTLQAEDQLKLWIHPTLAGSIPVLMAGCREDFVTLYRALAKRNQPDLVPASIGACLISGYNNWDRVNRYKQHWIAQHLDYPTEADWLVEFKRLISQKEQYQDQFILLSPGFYSGVSASELNLTDSEWLAASLKIRLEHESTHYCTKRFFNSMQNNLLDELIADYMGIVAAIGYYRSDWFLRFVGLESFPVYRWGGRLENYRGSPSLSDGAFQVLQILVKQAAENLERFDRQVSRSDRSQQNKLAILMTLTQLTLEELASEAGDELIKKAMDQTFASIQNQ